MANDSQFAHLMDEHRNLLRQFVVTELDLALTFCERALTTHQSAGASALANQGDGFNRNAENARRAYQSAIRAIQRSDDDIGTDSDIAERLQKLTHMLAVLNRDGKPEQEGKPQRQA
jgi:hypothetical protein